jgi:hypothetical protein
MYGKTDAQDTWTIGFGSDSMHPDEKRQRDAICHFVLDKHVR